MERSPSWQTNGFSASQGFPRTLGSPKVHYNIYWNPPCVRVLSQINPVHAPPPAHFLNMHLIIIPFTPSSSKWSLSLRFPQQKPVCSSHFCTCCIPRPSRSSRFYNPNNIWWGVQIINLLIMSFSSVPCYLVTLRPKYSPQLPILKQPQLTSLPQCERPGFTRIQNNRQNYSCVYLNFYVFELKIGRRDFAPNGSKHYLSSNCC